MAGNFSKKFPQCVDLCVLGKFVDARLVTSDGRREGGETRDLRQHIPGAPFRLIGTILKQVKTKLRPAGKTQRSV